MIRNYFKIAWRNIITKRFYSFLNVCGMAVAVSCCIFIYLYSSYNLSFDTYHKDSDKIFRLVYDLKLDKTLYDQGSAYATYRDLKTEAPQVKQAAFSVDKQSFIVSVDGDAAKRFNEENNVSFTTADWFKLFSFQFVAGSASGLNIPNNAVLRQALARKYFGNAEAIGKTIVINNQPIKVIGVLADGPYNSDQRAEMYLSFDSLLPLVPLYDKHFFTDMGYLSSKHSSYFVLNNVGDKAAVEKQIINIAVKHHFSDALKYYTFKLLPLSEVHFSTLYGGVVQKSLLWNLAIIGMLIISIAVFNYINLTVAQQTRRAAEVATRKVLGGSAKQIFMQFITESMLTSVLSVLFGVVLVLLLLPIANSYLFADAPVYIISYTNLILFAILLCIAVTVGTGVYPALLLSRVSIARSLKTNMFNLSAGIGRRIMVVFQNTVTQSLMMCTIIIILQVNFLKNTDVGFNRDSVVTIPIGKLTDSEREQLDNSLSTMPAVKGYSVCYKPPSVDTNQSATIQYNDQTKWEAWPALFAIADSGYCRTFGLKIITGRNIANRHKPKPEFLVNETMAKRLEKANPSNVIGKGLSAGDTKGIIVGVVKDFSVESLLKPIQPIVLLEDTNHQTNLAVKLSGNHITTAIGALQKQYERILPNQLFSYQFVDEQIARLYKAESIQEKLIWISASVAIFISLLGLLGLVSLIALQRTKEIGIRKVLGASVTQISVMLSRDFMVMMALAFVIATPISWWLMHNWLQNFAFRINIQWWVFALTGGIALVVSMGTVSFRSIKAAIANPVKSLRNE